MGNLSNQYDAAGNLVRQEDAMGQILCFYYDDLGRLSGKIALENCPGDLDDALAAEGAEHLASYTYDTAANGIGQLAEVSWGPDPDDNKDNFAYDTLGRMIS